MLWSKCLDSVLVKCLDGVFISAMVAHLNVKLCTINAPSSHSVFIVSWSGIRPSSTMLKHLLLRNRLANQSKILCGASLGRGNESLFAASGSHDQDGRHTHI